MGCRSSEEPSLPVAAGAAEVTRARRRPSRRVGVPRDAPELPAGPLPGRSASRSWSRPARLGAALRTTTFAGRVFVIVRIRVPSYAELSARAGASTTIARSGTPTCSRASPRRRSLADRAAVHAGWPARCLGGAGARARSAASVGTAAAHLAGMLAAADWRGRCGARAPRAWRGGAAWGMTRTWSCPSPFGHDCAVPDASLMP